MSTDDPKKTITTIFKTSEKVDHICNDIFKNVEQTKMDVIKVFQPYIQPKKTLDQLLIFYNVFLKAHETITQVSQQIHETYGEDIKIIDLQSITKNKLLDVLKLMKTEENNLLEYTGVKIVDDILNKSRRLSKEVIEKILPVYFINLLNKSSNEDEMKEISNFLMEFTDKKSFLARYSNAILDKTTFEDIGSDRKRLLDRTTNIEENFKKINKYNEKILGHTNAQSINRGLNKLLLISIKKVIADVLLVVEKEEGLDSVPFCMELNSHLRQSDEAEIKEIEELYVYKNEINKIVCNIFLGFIENTKTMEHPNKFCDIEKPVLDLKNALDSLEDNRNVTLVFLKNFGPFFKVNTIEEICQSFSKTLLKKILELSNQLDAIRKAIYLINNFFTLQSFTREVGDVNVKTTIENNSEVIIGTWREELASRTGRRFSSFIDANLKAFKSYYLPSVIRNNVVPKIKAIIWENILTKGYDDNENTLNESINEMFTGQ